MDILFTETVYVPALGLCIALLFLLAGASVYLGCAISNDDGSFIAACVAVMLIATFLIFSFITGGIYEKEYVYVNQADVTLEEILEYEVVADLGDVIKLEKIK